jgi:hypothetical protein
MLFAALLGAALGSVLFSAPVIGILAGAAAFGLSSIAGQNRTKKSETGSPALQDNGLGTNIGGYSFNAKSAANSQQIVYGNDQDRLLGGTVVFQDADPTGTYLSLIIAYAPHDMEFLELFLDNYRIDPTTFDNRWVAADGTISTLSGGSGLNRPTGAFPYTHYQGYVDFVWVDGNHTTSLDGQTLSNFSTKWTSDHILQGIAHLAIVFQYSSTVFPNGLPEIKISARGKEVLNPRPLQTLIVNKKYQILYVNDGAGGADTDFTAYGAADNNVGTIFIANTTVSPSAWSGTGSVGEISNNTGNTAAFIRDYLLDDKYGLGESLDNIDEKSFQDAATACEAAWEYSQYWGVDFTSTTGPLYAQDSPLPVPGDVAVIRSLREDATFDTDFTYVGATNNTVGERFTLTAIPRIGTTGIAGDGTLYIERTVGQKYASKPVFLASATPAEILETLAASMAGVVWYSQGKWRVKAGEYTAPTVTLTEDDLRGDLTVSTKHSRKDSYNRVTGTFSSQFTNNQQAQYPAVSFSSFVTEDGGEERTLDLSLPFTVKVQRTSMLANIALQKHRKQITVSGDFGLKAMKIQIADVVQITNSRFGFSSKPFEVIEWNFNSKNNEPIIHLVLREISSDVYDDDPLLEKDFLYRIFDVETNENWN